MKPSTIKTPTGLEIFTSIKGKVKKPLKVSTKLKSSVKTVTIKEEDINTGGIMAGSIKDVLESCHNDMKKIIYDNFHEITKIEAKANELIFTIKRTIRVFIYYLCYNSKKYIIKEGNKELINITI